MTLAPTEYSLLTDKAGEEEVKKMGLQQVSLIVCMPPEWVVIPDAWNFFMGLEPLNLCGH